MRSIGFNAGEVYKFGHIDRSLYGPLTTRGFIDRVGCEYVYIVSTHPNINIGCFDWTRKTPFADMLPNSTNLNTLNRPIDRSVLSNSVKVGYYNAGTFTPYPDTGGKKGRRKSKRKRRKRGVRRTRIRAN